MPRASSAVERLWQVNAWLQLRSSTLRRWLPVGIGVMLIGTIGLVYALLGDRGPARLNITTGTAEIELLGLDQAQAMALFDPAVSRMEVPKGAYSGNRPVPRETIDVLSVDALLVANAGMPDDIAKQLVTTLFERRQQMVEANRHAAFVSEPSAQQRLTIGVHPGAEDYYQRDKPAFIVEYAEPIGVGLSLLVLAASGLWQARAWLSNARKNRADRYNLQIAALVDQAEQAGTQDQLAEVRGSLFAIFHDVIADLDNDRIDENSLQSFSFVWDVAQSTLSQRQMMLAGKPAAKKPRRAEPSRLK